MKDDEWSARDERWMAWMASARHHQVWLWRYAALFAVTWVLAMLVSPWLFASSTIFIALAYEHREDRNDALEHCKRPELGS